MAAMPRWTTWTALATSAFAILAPLAGPAAQQMEPMRPPVLKAPTPTPHWFLVRDRYNAGVFDGDSGEMIGSVTTSMFSPAIRAHLDAGMLYAYGSFYTRTFYGERTDAVLFFDIATMQPVGEVIVPPKTAGIGHEGWLGLLNGRFLGVFNITPATSLSIVDVEKREFVGEISTPGCAGAYAIASGFLMPCGDGTLQYLALDENGQETARVRSRKFFGIDEDPVFDFATPGAPGAYIFVSFEGLVYEATVTDDGAVDVSEPWSIVTDEDREEKWRIGGSQPFAYNHEQQLLVTVMHQGGEDTFEDPGTEVWGFDTGARRRGYRITLDGDGEEPTMISGVQLTPDADPLLLIVPEDEDLLVYGGTTGRLRRTIKEAGGFISNF
jgi:methylamine dehydrogenase heavy chain